MAVKELIRIFVRGGIISPGDFLKILLVAEKLGAEYINFGSRQDILFAAKEKNKNILVETFQSINTDFEINTFQHQNISSSYVSQDIQQGKKWLASHTYHYVLNSFDYRPKLRINVVDPSQSLVPLFTGQINFIASNQENYWFVYLRFTEIHNVPWQLPLLVFGEDLNKVSKALEESPMITENWDYQKVYAFLTENVQMNNQPVTENLVLPETHFPYYEGINRLADGKYWLGLYWRNNEYRITNLKKMMEHCIETEIGKVSLTPWKSFIIKGIQEKNVSSWEKLMGSSGMNLRHSALELNWHLPALDQEALDLKFFLVRELDQLDVSTHGLTFTIKTTNDITLFTSVVIEKNTASENTTTYNIGHSKNFNQNLGQYQTYASNVPKSILAALIVELSHLYFERIQDEKTTSPKIQLIRDQVNKNLYQCIHCQTIYDERLGDKIAGIAPETPFVNLPKTYLCATCSGSLKSFVKMSV